MSFDAQQWAKVVRRDNPDISATHHQVFQVLCDHANADGECWPSIATLAAEAGCTPATVSRATNALVKANLLMRYSKAGMGAIYRIPIPYDFDPRANAHMGSRHRTAKPLGPEALREENRRMYEQLTGEPWYAPCESEAEYNALMEVYRRNAEAGISPFDTLRQLTGLGSEGVGRPLPYDQNVRQEGVETPSDRLHYNRGSQND